MHRGRAQVEAQFVYRLQTLGGFGGKADQLNAYSVFVNDPGYFERDLARYAGVTQQDLHHAVRKYLRTDNRVVLSVVPRGKLSLALRIRRRRWCRDARRSNAPSGRGSVASVPLLADSRRTAWRTACRSGQPSIGRYRWSRSSWCCRAVRRPISRDMKDWRPSPRT
jgi:hypothetical protein